jgi:hypothetical protein
MRPVRLYGSTICRTAQLSKRWTPASVEQLDLETLREVKVCVMVRICHRHVRCYLFFNKDTAIKVSKSSIQTQMVQNS